MTCRESGNDDERPWREILIIEDVTYGHNHGNLELYIVDYRRMPRGGKKMTNFQLCTACRPETQVWNYYGVGRERGSAGKEDILGKLHERPLSAIQGVNGNLRGLS